MENQNSSPATPAVGGETPPVNSSTPSNNAQGTQPTKEYIVDGKKVSLTDKQVTAIVQKGLYADKKLESVSILQKRTESLLNTLKTPEGLINVLKDPSLGNSPKEVFKRLMNSDIVDDELKETMARWVYDKVVVPASMDPAEREKQERENRLATLEKEKKEREELELSQRQQIQLNAIYEEVKNQISKQLLADKTFPQIPAAIQWVINKVRILNREGVPVTQESIKKAIGLAKSDFIKAQSSILDSIQDPEELISALGEERALKISKALVARLTAKNKITPEGADRPLPISEKLEKTFNRTPQGYKILDI